jgi:hypothetical protein
VAPSAAVVAGTATQRWAAGQRSRFERVLFRLRTHVTRRELPAPDCFISYAWGDPEHEHWVEYDLATDLTKAGIPVLLDRWENARIGASLPRFMERAASAGRVIVVGTPLYLIKYHNEHSPDGSAIVVEGDLIGRRMMGSDARRAGVLPVLLVGTEDESFPPLLRGRVFADFRHADGYFGALLDLVLSLYEIHPNDPVAVELRAVLRGEPGHQPPVVG